MPGRQPALDSNASPAGVTLTGHAARRLQRSDPPASAVYTPGQDIQRHDNDTGTGPYVPVGGAVTFTYIVTNPGIVPLTTVSVIDDNGTPGNAADDFNATYSSGDTNSNGQLDVGETWTYTATRTLTAVGVSSTLLHPGQHVTGSPWSVADAKLL